MGSSDYGMPVLKNLIAENFNIVSVYTKSDPITKIKLKQSNPIESLAISNQIPVHLPKKIDEKEIDLLTKIAPDIIIVAAYGLFLPPLQLERLRVQRINRLSPFLSVTF